MAEIYNGRYALADPSSGLTVISMEGGELNMFGSYTLIKTTQRDSYPLISDAPVVLQVEKKPNYLSTFIYGFIGAAVSACLAAVAVSIVASATVLTGGAALAACALLGASLGTLLATEGMVESDLRTGYNRSPLEFTVGLAGGMFVGLEAGAAVYGVIAAAPILAAGISTEASIFLGGTTFTTTTVSTIIEAIPTIVEIGADITVAAKAIFSLNDAYGWGSGYNPILDSIFDNDIEAYETTEFFVDMLCCGYIWGAEEYARTYFASDGNEEGQGEVKAKSTEDSDKSNDAKDRNKNPKPSHQDEENTSNNGHGRNKQKEEGVHFEQGKEEAKLKFDDDDLVYGPSANQKLSALQKEAGGKLLSDIGNPYDDGYSNWLEYSIAYMEKTVKRGNKIHFDLTYMEDVQGVLNNTGPYKNTYTAGELRYIYENWDRFCNNVKFYFNKKEVLPPWM